MSIILDGDTGVSTLQNHEQITVDSSGNVNLAGDLRLHGGYTGLSSTLSGAMTVLGHNAEASQTNTNQIVSASTGYHSNFIRMYYNQGISFHVNNTTNNAGDIVYDFANPGNQVASSLQAMNISTTGEVTTPYQPACTIACQAADINWDTGSLVGYGTTGSIKLLDTHNAFNMSSYTYTVPVAGNYYIGYTCNDVSSTSGRMRAYLRVNGSNVGNAIHARGTTGISSDLDMRTVAIVIPLQVNDTVNVYVGEGTVDTFGSNYFTIYMLG